MTRSTLSILLPAALLLALAGCGEEAGIGAAEAGGPAAAAADADGGDAKAMGDVRRHRLYQAAAATGDPEIIQDMYQRIGLMDGQVADQEAVQAFATRHGTWAQNHIGFIQQVSTPDQARAWYDANK